MRNPLRFRPELNSFKRDPAIMSIHTQMVLHDAENGSGFSGATEELAELNLFLAVSSVLDLQTELGLGLEDRHEHTFLVPIEVEENLH